MSLSSKKKLAWAFIAVCIFALFLWLFNLAMPEAAFQFATGTTAIIMSGLLSGRYLAKLWQKAEQRIFNKVVTSLILLTLLCLFLIGIFVNKMIEQTGFNYFFFTVIALFLANAFVAMLITMVRARIKTNIRSAQTALVQSKTELQLIQAQLSPHFLFNTLNNLYGLSLTEHQKVPSLLLKLSEFLRYSVYEAKEVFVPLQDELNYLKNYIEFEKIRLGERLLITVEMQDTIDKFFHIAPMLLIVFVENAFKHSKNNEDENIFIDITLKASHDYLSFSVKNSCALQNGMQQSSKTYSGFGLESVKKRLELLYPHRYELQIVPMEKTLFSNAVDKATMKIKCLIIDDEPIARQILERYCSLLPEIEVVASCSNALEAKRMLQSKTVDLIFLDINMPVLDGLSFMKTLAKSPIVILTTAYKEFAHEAFDLAACDYLLKPFSLDRFMIAVDKAKEKLPQKKNPTEEASTENFTYIKSEGKIYKINFEEVCFVEANGNNVTIVTTTGAIKSTSTFAAFENMLPKPPFIRLHRSFIINKNKISHIEGNRVFIGATEIPIGANYKELFFRTLGIR